MSIPAWTISRITDCAAEAGPSVAMIFAKLGAAAV
jgi:hypothetical protein